MSKLLDYYCAKLRIYKDNKIVYEEYLHKIPLNNKTYKSEGISLYSTESPCIMQRKVIERNTCVNTAKQIMNGKKYLTEDIKWLFDLYDIECDIGDSISVNY